MIGVHLRLLAKKKGERRRSGRSGTSTGAIPTEAKGKHAVRGKDAALEAAMHQHEQLMERYFKMKGDQHADSHALKRLKLEKDISDNHVKEKELAKDISNNQVKEKELVFEKYKFDTMHSGQIRQLEIMQEGQRNQAMMMQTFMYNVVGMQQKLIDKL
jgi:Tfp pilus assembly protein PilE